MLAKNAARPSGARARRAALPALFWLLAAGLGAGACAGGPSQGPMLPGVRAPAEAQPISRIAFGACSQQDDPQPIWDAVSAARPGLFVFLGDNIYSKARSHRRLKKEYAALAAQPGFARLRAETPVLATWDDHDFGANDGGADNPRRELFEDAFENFFPAPAGSSRDHRPGIYDAVILGPPGRRVQILLLDTRFFRSPLTRRPEGESEIHGRYVVSHDPDASVLGEAQWRWLEERLREPADLRVVASSIQVLALDHGWEKWGNLPAERTRLLDLIRDTGAGRVVLLSGDRHMGEIARLPVGSEGPETGPAYPLYEVTTGGLTHGTGLPFEKNRYRIVSEDVIREPNFGLLEVEWGEDPTLRLSIRGVGGEILLEHRQPLGDLEASP